jgi:hypothetical protein
LSSKPSTPLALATMPSWRAARLMGQITPRACETGQPRLAVVLSCTLHGTALHATIAANVNILTSSAGNAARNCGVLHNEEDR